MMGHRNDSTAPSHAGPPERDELVAVVPAAGRGSRLGIDAPKVFADLGPAVAWEVLAARLSSVVRRAHLVLSPQGAAWLEQHPLRPPAGLNVTVSVQPEPVGMGDAVLGALPHLHNASNALVVWGDQLGVSSSMTSSMSGVNSPAQLDVSSRESQQPLPQWQGPEQDDAGRAS